jgi:hypothetical protein
LDLTKLFVDLFSFCSGWKSPSLPPTVAGLFFGLLQEVKKTMASPLAYLVMLEVDAEDGSIFLKKSLMLYARSGYIKSDQSVVYGYHADSEAGFA